MAMRLKMMVVLACSLLTASAGFAASSSDFNPGGYYLMRADLLRKCPTPLCGGYWVRSVNRKLTRCVDGSYQSECYVATLRSALATPLDPGAPVLLGGRIRAHSYPGFGDLGVLVVRAAWRGATDASARGSFVGLENNGIVCITTPCFSFDEHVLNRPLVRQVSDIELRATGASDEQVDAALQIIAEGGVLIASGVNKQTEDTAGTGLMFLANQFYLPID